MNKCGECSGGARDETGVSNNIFLNIKNCFRKKMFFNFSKDLCIKIWSTIKFLQKLSTGNAYFFRKITQTILVFNIFSSNKFLNIGKNYY